MNFYPHLEKSYVASKSISLFLIANAAMILLGIGFLLSWYFLYYDFFTLLRETLLHTHITEEIARQLITQAYSIGRTLLVALPIILLLWRISIPITLGRLNEFSQSKPWWHIFMFDSGKIVMCIILGLLLNYQFHQGQWLIFSFLTLLLLLGFSLFRYSQIIYFSSPHNHPFVVIFRSWFSHPPLILFLHALDILTFFIGFCLLGIVLASFVYLPFILFVIVMVTIMYIFGRLSLVWKGIWSYASCAILTEHSSS